jgi:hypothetical protein
MLTVLVLHELQVLRKAKRNSKTCVARVGQQQHSLRRRCTVLINSIETADRLQPESLHLSSHYPTKV